MSAVAFDPLEYARQLEAAGMPRPQAEVIAKGLTAMFIHNFDTLVTKDYLETRLESFEYRLEAKMSSLLAQAFTSENPGYAKIEDRFDRMDARFDNMDARFDKTDARLDNMDARFDKMDDRLDKVDDRFGRMDDHFTKIDRHFNQIDVRFARVNVMLGIILAAVAVPILQMVLTLAI